MLPGLYLPATPAPMIAAFRSRIPKRHVATTLFAALNVLNRTALATCMTSGGTFPNNTSGGQLSAGQAGAAGGFLGVVEAIRQLTDQAGVRSVPCAQLGLVAVFGMVTYGRCLCTGAVILGRST